MADLDPQIESACATLTARSQRAFRRARRARIGSNERTKHMQQAQILVSCVHEIRTDRKLRDELIDRGDINRGWRTLANAVVEHAASREKRKQSRRRLLGQQG